MIRNSLELSELLRKSVLRKDYFRLFWSAKGRFHAIQDYLGSYK